jgi:hypothetical protein
MKRSVVVILTLLLITDCAVRRVGVRRVAPPDERQEIKTPVKAHLLDGTTVVFPTGLVIAGGKLVGNGTAYDLTLAGSQSVTEIPIDRVLALEAFENTMNKGLTVFATGGTTFLTIVGAVALIKALFGSCPTVYSGASELESELFSYSIAPIFEMGDLDRLRAQPNSDGVLELEVRNEALETHYLNHFELTEVRHSGDEIVAPDERGDLVALKAFWPIENAIDRKGRNLVRVLHGADDLVFSTDASTLQEVKVDDLRDFVEVQASVPAGRENVALLFRFRNSLLNTVLLYDVMLAASGARAVDWMGSELEQIRPALELASWYSSRMGMRVEVWDGGAYRQVAKLADTGPIAWKDVAVVVPGPDDGKLRVRLNFAADNWRIDQVRVAADVRRPDSRSLPLKEIVFNGAGNTDALQSLASLDRRYVQTSPGQKFLARFDTGRETGPRTFLLRSHGFYTEWVRGSWLEKPTRSATFTPSDEALLEAMVRWRKVQPEFEAQFHATKIPVR